MIDNKPQDTRVKFLNAAEELFADHGYEGTKIRAIADKSRVNLGALHHYWGNKLELFKAVCERRLRPMNEERLRLMQAWARQSEHGQADIRGLLRASLEPTFFIANLNEEEQAIFRKFYGRVLTDPTQQVGQIIRDIFQDTSSLFLTLLRKHCAHLNDKEFYWRVHCVFGAYIYAPAFSHRIVFHAGDDFDPHDSETAIDEIVQFLAGGMMAPSLYKEKEDAKKLSVAG